MDNEMLVGIAGDRIVRQTCFAFSEIFTLDKNNNLTRKHIFTQIIPKLIELLTEHELLSSKNNQPPKINAEILLAYKSELFEICSNFTICKYEDYQAVGNISNYVQFILANTNKNHDVNQRIIKALDIAKAKGMDVKVVKATMKMSGRYLAEVEKGDGFCKLVIDNKKNCLVGCHMIGSYTSEMIYGAALMIEKQMPIEQIKELVFPHPTVSEVIREALFL